MYLLDILIGLFIIYMILRSFFVTTTHTIRKLAAYFCTSLVLYLLISIKQTASLFGEVFKTLDKTILSFALTVEGTQIKVPEKFYKGTGNIIIPMIICLLVTILVYYLFFIIFKLIIRNYNNKRGMAKVKTTNHIVNCFLHLLLAVVISYFIIDMVVLVTSAVNVDSNKIETYGFLYKTFKGDKVPNIFIDLIERLVKYTPETWKLGVN